MTMTTMAIQLTIVLSSSAGVLDTADLFFDSDVDDRLVDKRIKERIADWSLRPGDKIEICGNEAAFENL